MTEPMSATQVKRLHITPLNPAILDAILHSAIRPLATDVSFHTIQTYPENSFGFVSLPAMEADKIAKKLNGSILKGKKLKVQEARQPKGPSPIVADAPHEATGTKDRSLKRKLDNGEVMSGHELPSQRKVMRGWTEAPKDGSTSSKSKAKKREKSARDKSKYTNNAECLFRAVPPSNRKNVEASDKKTKRKESKGKTSDTVVIHEFENSVKHPSFLRSEENASKTKLSSEYVDDKGWVDREGNVKEGPVVSKPKVQSKIKISKKKTPVSETRQIQREDSVDSSVTEQSAEDSSETSSSGSSSEDDTSSDDDTSSESDDESDAESSLEAKDETPANVINTQTASLGLLTTTTDDDSSTTGEEKTKEHISTESTPSGTDSKASTPSDSDDSEVPQSPKPFTPQTEVHPLEALFKRPARPPTDTNAKPDLEINTQFSFFGNNEGSDDGDDHDNEHNINEPHTPFTKRDLQSRSLRSAAPTPDTAAVDKKFWQYASSEDDVDDNDDLENSGDEKEQSGPTHGSSKKSGAKAGDEETDPGSFAQWFWENRGDNNRAWKRRRREVAKERRQRDNRKRGARGR